ncbi:MAG: tol-pal system YbgF family protein [Bacteroidia bacterium]
MLKPTKNKIFDKRLCLSEDELLRYASGKMNEREKHHVEKHITDCELCSDALDGVLLMKDFSVIGSYKKEIIDSLAGKKNIERKNQFNYYWLAAAAVFAVVLLSGIYFQFVEKEGKLTNNLAVISEDKLKEPSPPEQLNRQKAEAADQNEKPVEEKLSKTDEMNSGSNNKIESLKSSEGAVTTTAKVESELRDSQITVAYNAAADRSITGEEEKENSVALSGIADDESGNKIQEVMVATPAIENVKSAGNLPASAESKQKVNMGMEKKSALESQDSHLNEIYSDIENKKYEEALNKLNVLLKSHPGNLRAIYYSGLVYYFLNKPVKAVDNFDIVLNVPEDSLYEDARWYKALALIKMKDNKSARIILSKIIGEKSSYKKPAEKMLEQIDGN